MRAPTGPQRRAANTRRTEWRRAGEPSVVDAARAQTLADEAGVRLTVEPGGFVSLARLALAIEQASGPASWAGYRTHTHARSTGTLVVLVESAAQGLDTEGGAYTLICDAHGTTLAGSSSVLRTYMRHPEDWCDECREKWERERA